MPINRKKQSLGLSGTIIIIAVLAGIVAGFFLLRGKEADAPPPQPPVKPDKVRGAVKDQPVIDYGSVQKDPVLKEEMKTRKSEYGIEKGLDFILKPEESLKIGGITVPMKEILEKIRLEKGDIIESDLTETPDIESIMEERKSRIRELIEMERRFVELGNKLKDPSVSADEDQKREIAAKMATDAETVALFKRYMGTVIAIEDTRKKLETGNLEARESARTTINTLKFELEKLERLLNIPKKPEKQREAYGIYVVRKGDNIWNIHFKFLKEYFSHRQISLAPMSDEPDARGHSSGVGKILKFSENMVYIYNLKEKKLDVDLNLLQPLSKVVVFNMGEILTLLDPIDTRHVNRIKFDGETLWIPAEQ